MVWKQLLHRAKWAQDLEWQKLQHSHDIAVIAHDDSWSYSPPSAGFCSAAQACFSKDNRTTKENVHGCQEETMAAGNQLQFTCKVLSTSNHSVSYHWRNVGGSPLGGHCKRQGTAHDFEYIFAQQLWWWFATASYHCVDHISTLWFKVKQMIALPVVLVTVGGLVRLSPTPFCLSLRKHCTIAINQLFWMEERENDYASPRSWDVLQ